MVHKKEKSFDLLSGFNGYAPGWGGMFAMLGLLLAGSLLGSFVQFLLIRIPGMDVSMSMQMLITYPIMFIPPMMYASISSRKAMIWNEECTPLDSYKVAAGQINRFTLAFMCAAGTIALAIVTEPAMKIIPTTGQFWGPFYEYMKSAMDMLTGGPLWISLLTTAIFAPFFEEWLCRGMILRGLLKKTNPAVAIIVSALFFAAIHMNPWQALPAFVLGSLFGIVYYKTGSLKLTMLMHCANNSFSVLLSQIPAFQGKEYISEIITDQMQYGLIYLCAAAMTFLLVYRVLRLK